VWTVAVNPLNFRGNQGLHGVIFRISSFAMMRRDGVAAPDWAVSSATVSVRDLAIA
jgi:hypothetical protein